MTRSPFPLHLHGLVRSGPIVISEREKRFILAMIDAGLNDQQITAFFSQPGRDFNHNRISSLRGTDRTLLPPPASGAELQAFFDNWRSPSRLPSPWLARNVSGADAALWRVTYRFHPVGQGLLHSGELRQGRRAPFRWIYDCGSVTAPAKVITELDRLRAASRPIARHKPVLDLVTLSHFDQDHVSGIVHLLDRFEVRLILLPFLTLWQRLWIAATTDDPDADFLRFLIDPVGFLLTAAGEGPTRIVFVPPSDGDPPAPPVDGPPERGPRGEFDDRPMKLRLETERAPDVVEGEIAGVTGKRFPEAEVLKAGSVLDIDGLWEFVPYNDARQARQCRPGFPATVEPFMRALLTATTKPERQIAFDALKAHYDRTFGSNAYRRNIISLFLYSGPVPAPADGRFQAGPVTDLGTHFRIRRDRTRLTATTFAILFTGDGSLNSRPRRDAFERHFSPYHRLDKTAVFQVMHHGASRNSSTEVADLVAPRASIFCSDPSKGHGHPDAVVLRQFWAYNCVQVDDVTGWCMMGLFEF